MNDEYFNKAKIDGYRSRAAYKLLQLNDKFKVFDKKPLNILDLGCAPGGWLQVAGKLCNKNSRILGIDILPIKKINGISFIQKDFFEEKTLDEIQNFFNGNVDILLNDMSPNTTGNKKIDHLRIISLVEAVLDISKSILRKDGYLICKIFQGGAQGELLKKISTSFSSVKYFKPQASRQESPETYIIGKKK